MTKINMGIVTKVGDKGKTKLLSGEEVSKNDLRIKASGALDELNCHLGFAKSIIKKKSIKKEIHEIQIDLMRLGTELSAKGKKSLGWVTPTETHHILWLDSKIVELEKVIKLPRSFLIPGTCPESAAIEMARAVARRVERKIVSLSEKDELKNKNCLIYINRLSDYLFLLARKVENILRIPFETKE